VHYAEGPPAPAPIYHDEHYVAPPVAVEYAAPAPVVEKVYAPSPVVEERVTYAAPAPVVEKVYTAPAAPIVQEHVEYHAPAPAPVVEKVYVASPAPVVEEVYAPAPAPALALDYSAAAPAPLPAPISAVPAVARQEHHQHGIDHDLHHVTETEARGPLLVHRQETRGFDVTGAHHHTRTEEYEAPHVEHRHLIPEPHPHVATVYNKRIKSGVHVSKSYHSGY